MRTERLGSVEADHGTRPSNWADDLAAASALYYFLCGLVALALDAAHALRVGRFTVISPYSLPVMKWLYSAGLLAALVAFVGHPNRRVWRVTVAVMCAVFAAVTAIPWILWFVP